ncbi:MAG: DUF4430 domain-containing protein [Candidatus Aenigmatarchaeota archaeon]
MDKYDKLNLLLVMLLALGMLYLAAEVTDLEERVTELESDIIETEVRINNGTAERKSTVGVVKGSTALQALEKEATVETESYTGLGEMIVSIDGVENNETENTFWLTGTRKGGEEEWQSAEKSASEIRLEGGQQVLFWYGNPEEAPFEVPIQ